MSKIFISYRRDDSADVSGRIFDRLAARFGKDAVFRDVYSIPYGADFKQYINGILQRCAVQLIVIGPHWLDITDQNGRRRLDDPRDLVRIEVETGLERGIPVIPLLVGGAEIPSADRLPQSLRPLPSLNMVRVQTDPGLDKEFGRLITQIREKIPPRPQPPGWESVLTPRLVDMGFNYQVHDGVGVVVPPVVEVAGGAFDMGSTVNENEQPVHSVTLAEYAIGTYPVTVAEYACFVNSGHRAPPDKDIAWQSQLSRRDHPIVNVSWQDATAYAAWLADRTGQAWRLPSEEEWEKAARWDAANGTSREYPWGDKFEATRCNTAESGNKHGTTPVGTYPRGASPCGAQDMAGNVWEWTASKYKPDQDEHRVRRGGSYADSAGSARAARRLGDEPQFWGSTFGFRLALGVAPGA